MQGGILAANLINVSLFTRRRKTTAPEASRPTRLQTFLPRSMPSTETFIIYPSGCISGEPITPEGGAGHSIKLRERRPNHRLHRRVGSERTAAPRAHLGTPRRDPGAAIQLHLEPALGRGRGDLL